MTLNTKIGVSRIFWQFSSTKRISRAKSLEIDQYKLPVKFLALNVDFNGPSLDLLGSMKPAHKGIKERYPLKVVILPLLASLA